jgi:ribonuclease D
MPDPHLPPPVWVDIPARLDALVADLAAQPCIAVDTESNSLHAYHEQVCLIQFSTPQADYILDPLALPDLALLAPIFANPAIEKIFHAAEYDLICLRRDFGWQAQNLFDTMVAARTLGWPQVGLAAALETQFGVTHNKRHQRADWAARPLTREQLAYAQIDTHYLIPLRERLAAALQAADHWAEAVEEFERLAQANANGRTPPQFDPQNFWHISGARDLSGRAAAILRELFIYRDQVARRLNRPPFKVMADSTLLAIAKTPAPTLAALAAIPGMTPGQINRHGRSLLQAIARGQHAPAPRPLHVELEDEAVLDRYDVLRKWRKQKAKDRGVESDIIIPRDVLLEIARHSPHSIADLDSISGFGPARRAHYGAEIIQLLNSKFQNPNTPTR